MPHVKNGRFWRSQGWIFWLFNSHQWGQVSKRAQLHLMQFWQIFFKCLFIGTQHAESHWRFGNCVCCWSLLGLEVPPLVLPCRRGIFFSCGSCSSPWGGFELTRPLVLRNPIALVTGLGHISISATWIGCGLPTAHRKTSHHSFLVFVGISASCWKKTGHCLCMKTSETVFLPKPSSVQTRSDCSDSHMAGPGFCNCNASGDNCELI